VVSLTPGSSVVVEVPATSANLGPGFDCFGLALDWTETVQLEVLESGYAIDVTGEGADALPRDDSHLIIRSALTGFADLGVAVPGLRLAARNTIPHGRGLGSSSAAIVAGLLAARALAGQPYDPGWLLQHASAIEGHPDNVAAAIYGGFVMAYGGADGITVARGRLFDGLAAVAFVPETPLATSAARGLLPSTVPYEDAAANAGRAALLVHALANQPDLLHDATRDWLHQDYRSDAMPASAALLQALRGRGLAAVVSGAGPTVLVLGPADTLDTVATERPAGFRVVPTSPGGPARVVDSHHVGSRLAEAM
jgi:homoserine kinase